MAEVPGQDGSEFVAGGGDAERDPYNFDDETNHADRPQDHMTDEELGDHLASLGTSHEGEVLDRVAERLTGGTEDEEGEADVAEEAPADSFGEDDTVERV